MKNQLLVARVAVAAAVLFAGACGARQKASMEPTVRVGEAVTVKQPVKIAALAGNPANFSGQTIRLEGTVKAVCQGMGCWVEVQEPGGASFIAKSLDESVLLPKDCAGKRIVVQGVVMTLPGSAAAEPAPADHACPKPEYVVSTQGAELY